ncbi:MAG: carboxyltransferase domain-containing protein [Labilithrix sp.]|nr:carboxyltransferase domain-containing protein [Labilithrix sp.]MCW5812745.1 carboxyltransferase domain-containing protein [Labilithrix sp.]
MRGVLAPFGDRAVRFAVPASIGARRVLFERLRALPGAEDVVLCEEVGLVRGDVDPAAIARALGEPIDEGAAAPSARHVVRVVYDGEDLAAVAAAIGVDASDVVARHREPEYRVSMLGFLPGFAYLRGLPPELRLSRRAPRPRVPARSLAIAADYTGIYPVASAGGWHLLGRALDAPRFALGDAVSFVPARGAPPEPTTLASTAVPNGPHLVVTRVAGLALFVDAGRPGRMHEGMPPGGPLVRGAFARANALAGNTAAACAIELTGMLEVEARGATLDVADDTHATTLRHGDRFTLASGDRRARYLALAGGIDAPIADGSRCALLAAGIGRPLRRGDVLMPGGDHGDHGMSATPRDDDGGDLALLPGPDATPALLDRLCTTEFTISSTSDRSGTRLTGGEGLHTDAGTRPSTPMLEGAIELTPSGLVVLGPDHPTTGGYPVVALLRAHSRDRFFTRPLGAPVRFTLA